MQFLLPEYTEYNFIGLLEMVKLETYLFLREEIPSKQAQKFKLGIEIYIIEVNLLTKK